jgi:hypothetical protein
LNELFGSKNERVIKLKVPSKQTLQQIIFYGKKIRLNAIKITEDKSK